MSDRPSGARIPRRPEAEAAQFAALAEQGVAGCSARREQRYPDAPVAFTDHGTVAVEEGDHVYGIGYHGGWGQRAEHLAVASSAQGDAGGP